MALNQIEYNSVYVCHDLAFLVKSLHVFCFPIAFSREETVFWHVDRVTPPHFIEGGSLQKPSFVCLCWLGSKMVDFVVCTCTILCMPART